VVRELTIVRLQVSTVDFASFASHVSQQFKGAFVCGSQRQEPFFQTDFILQKFTLHKESIAMYTRDLRFLSYFFVTVCKRK
jgi:hypothetical protein